MSIDELFLHPTDLHLHLHQHQRTEYLLPARVGPDTAWARNYRGPVHPTTLCMGDSEPSPKRSLDSSPCLQPPISLILAKITLLSCAGKSSKWDGHRSIQPSYGYAISPLAPCSVGHSLPMKLLAVPSLLPGGILQFCKFARSWPGGPKFRRPF